MKKNGFQFSGASLRALRVGTALCMVVAVAGCDQTTMRNPFKKQDENEVSSAAGGIRSTRLVERDVEAPQVFQVTEAGLWDGRPSLGGVWAAHPDVTDPERVIIRNSANGKFVIGALFRKERATPGPRLQLSSDAAEALGILAGQPANLNVTALRREETEKPQEAAAALPEASSVETATLDPVKASATAALAPAAKPAAKPAAPKPVASNPAASGLDKAFIQLGIFSIEQNAKNTAETMRLSGMVPSITEQSSKGKTFWRVTVGPARNVAERAELLKKIKAEGFTDAYAVRG